MSDLRNIEPPYLDGMEAKKEKNYLRAARYFRICSYYYELGELPVYDEQLDFYGKHAHSQYKFCKYRLTDEARRMLEKEEREHRGSWREFVYFNYQKIMEEANMPSPNRPVEKNKRKRWKLWRNFLRDDSDFNIFQFYYLGIGKDIED